MSMLTVKRGVSVSPDPVRAVQDVFEAIHQDDACLVILFMSSRYDRPDLEAALRGVFRCPVIGCTTSGEIISQAGYLAGGLVGVSLASPVLFVHPRLLAPLTSFGFSEGRSLAAGLRAELELGSDFDPRRMFSLLLVDGLSMLEEQLVATLHQVLEGLPLFGGSAGDDLSFRETHVYCDGRFHRNAAVLTLFETRLPFVLFQTQHFEPTDTRLVITGSDCASRTVTEINGGPAAAEYAKAVGLEISGLSPQIFAAHPVMLKIGGEYYVRSIQKVNADGSLTFFCAIDDGLVLTVGRGKQLVESLAETLHQLRRQLPTLKLILGCDCILRRLELQQKGLTQAAEAVLQDVEFVGFSTYGEQVNGIHVNQTLTGIALGG